jgi:hypothetical protein
MQRGSGRGISLPGIDISTLTSAIPETSCVDTLMTTRQPVTIFSYSSRRSFFLAKEEEKYKYKPNPKSSLVWRVIVYSYWLMKPVEETGASMKRKRELEWVCGNEQEPEGAVDNSDDETSSIHPGLKRRDLICSEPLVPIIGAKHEQEPVKTPTTRCCSFMTTPIHVLVLSSRMVPIYFYG